MFEQQHILITGGSSGLGFGLAQALAREGARLTLVARDTRKLEQAAQQLLAEIPHARVRTLAVDVSDEARCAEAIGRLVLDSGGIDTLINSAGILREGYFEQLPMADFHAVMDINFFGLLHATRAALPSLKARRGRIVNIASLAGLTGVFGYTPYCAAKHALVGFSEALRYELKPAGVRVQLVCPPEFDSPMVEALDMTRTPENRAHVLTVPKETLSTIVEGTLAGMRSGRFLIVPGPRAATAAFGIRHFPGLTRIVGDRAVAAATRQARSGPSTQ